MNFIKMDINIAYSMINMKLRDFYSSLDSLCEDMDIDKNELVEHFEKNGYIYDESKNQFSLK
ncbi:DUF4250 domain-containing protein [Fusobacterium perfoetens]|uniref:DUF4250 domain-containing protein n=1 Tax=Fusobacterium perfoetens TaxID=852 RepID=UPI000483CCED|nr:DUF4250 domain-containing protein [Fusobacterium perfoetens]